MQYYQFHIGDYTTATVHLTALEDLAYRRLIDFYYMTEGPIPQDKQMLSRRLRVAIADLEVVLSEFFYETEKGYVNDRCQYEVDAFLKRVETKREAGRKGGLASKRSKRKAGVKQVLSNSQADAKLPITHYPLPIIEEIYKEYPKKVGKGDAVKAIKKALTKIDAKELKSIVMEYAKAVNGQDKQYIPNPATWFNQERWTDDRSLWSSWDKQEKSNKFRSGLTDEQIRAEVEAYTKGML